MHHGSRAVPGHMLPVHLPAVGSGQTLRAKVSFLHLHQSHSFLLPSDDGHGEERAADVPHVVLHRLEDRVFRHIRRREPAAHLGHHRAEPGGVRNAAADAPEDRVAARHQIQRQGEVEGSVLGRRDADDRGAGDDLRGGSGLFSPTRGETFIIDKLLTNVSQLLVV